MNFHRLYVEMAMMQGDDMPQDVVLVLQVFAGGMGVVVYYADANTHKALEQEPHAYPSRPHGQLDMQNVGDFWQLGNIYAEKGWGPLLCDIAIEYATAH